MLIIKKFKLNTLNQYGCDLVIELKISETCKKTSFEMQRIVAPFIGYATVVNGGSVALFWYDKQQAFSQGWRVPEKSLCLSALLGGWVGGYWAMEMFHHKTKKQSFRLTYHIATAVNVACFALLLFMFDW